VQLNERALRLCSSIVESSSELRIGAFACPSGARLIDFGVSFFGGLEAGLCLARVCLAGLGTVSYAPGDSSLWPGPTVAVATDHPIAACMASQYAGWQLAGKDDESGDKYFAMGSGPMRAAAGREELFETIGLTESAAGVVGVLECGQLPPPSLCRKIAEACSVKPSQLTLLFAPTASQAGSVQIVARSVETTLHKLHQLGFDLSRIISGYGTAPLPPVAKNDMAGIGRTNDAVLYGSRVTLWVTGDDETLCELGPKVPSCASRDYGEPFGSIFARYDYDFYKIDPHLFSPAEVTLMNIDTGKAFTYGAVNPEVIRQSFRD